MVRPLPQNCARAAEAIFGAIGVKDMSFFKNLWNDQSGASAAEYALILAIVGTGIALAAVGLGQSISTAMNEAGNCIKSPPTSSTGTANC